MGNARKLVQCKQRANKKKKSDFQPNHTLGSTVLSKANRTKNWAGKYFCGLYRTSNAEENSVCVCVVLCIITQDKWLIFTIVWLFECGYRYRFYLKLTKKNSVIFYFLHFTCGKWHLNGRLVSLQLNIKSPVSLNKIYLKKTQVKRNPFFCRWKMLVIVHLSINVSISYQSELFYFLVSLFRNATNVQNGKPTKPQHRKGNTESWRKTEQEPNPFGICKNESA